MVPFSCSSYILFNFYFFLHLTIFFIFTFWFLFFLFLHFRTFFICSYLLLFIFPHCPSGHSTPTFILFIHHFFFLCSKYRLLQSFVLIFPIHFQIRCIFDLNLKKRKCTDVQIAYHPASALTTNYIPRSHQCRQQRYNQFHRPKTQLNYMKNLFVVFCSRFPTSFAFCFIVDAILVDSSPENPQHAIISHVHRITDEFMLLFIENYWKPWS